MEAGFEGGERDGQLGRGLGEGHRAADGAAVANLGMADQRHGLAQQGPVLGHEPRAFERRPGASGRRCGGARARRRRYESSSIGSRPPAARAARDGSSAAAPGSARRRAPCDSSSSRNQRLIEGVGRDRTRKGPASSAPPQQPADGEPQGDSGHDEQSALGDLAGNHHGVGRLELGRLGPRGGGGRASGCRSRLCCAASSSRARSATERSACRCSRAASAAAGAYRSKVVRGPVSATLCSPSWSAASRLRSWPKPLPTATRVVPLAVEAGQRSWLVLAMPWPSVSRARSWKRPVLHLQRRAARPSSHRPGSGSPGRGSGSALPTRHVEAAAPGPVDREPPIRRFARQPPGVPSRASRA